jgi:hypothetical protein
MQDKCSRTENTDGRVLHISSYKDELTRTNRKKNVARVQIEVACNEPIGADIRKMLGEELGKLNDVIVVDEAPDWIYSIIAFHHGQLVELSVVLRQFFRASKPGTEQDTSTRSGRRTLKPGAWVYESLRFHGLFGVQALDLKGLLSSMAGEFEKNQLGQASKRKLRDRSEGQS